MRKRGHVKYFYPFLELNADNLFKTKESNFRENFDAIIANLTGDYTVK